MNTETRQRIEAYLRDQMANADATARSYVYDSSGRKLLNRNIFVKLRSHAQRFLDGDQSQSWCVVTGLRGAGKTTVLMQLFSVIQSSQADRLYISVDKITQLLGVSLYDVLRVYEDISGVAFERRTQPLFLFIDEAQYDPKWGVTLKDVYDRARHKVFIFTTGSAALALNMNSDVARRPTFEKMYPLSFTEYMKLKHGKTEVKGLCKEIRDALFTQTHAQEVYEMVRALEPKIQKYLLNIDRHEFDTYLTTGSLPSVLMVRQPMAIYERVQKSLERIINSDIARLYSFRTDTVRRIATVLYVLASADQVSYESLSKQPVELDRHTAKEVLDALVQTETLIRVQAFTGSHIAQVRQPSKYHFMAPVFRAAYFSTVGSVLSPETERGKLLEDFVVATLYRVLSVVPTAFITYDAQMGGADFVFGSEHRKIVLEVGSGTKGSRQVEKTMNKTGANYGLVVSRSELRLDEERDIVYITIQYFALS